VKIPLSPTARAVLEARYLARDSQGRIEEGPEGMFMRVARAVARAEKLDSQGRAEEE